MTGLSWRRPFDARVRLGRRGERAAARYLKRHHHRIVARNYRCPVGEIDLICRDGRTLVFVEVRTRSDDSRADPLEAIRLDKWRRVERTARYYLAARGGTDLPIRFDFVAVLWPLRGPVTIEHIEDAHCPTGW